MESAIGLGMPKDRITLGHMSADTDGLERSTALVTPGERAAMRAQWGGAEAVFLYVGVLNDRKGVLQLIDAWERLERDHPGPWALWLAGTGELEGRIRERVHASGLKGVWLHGHVDYDGIARLYAAADVLVMPTLEDNWSLVVPEAMACGLPVLCSRYNGCHPELIRPGGNGWIFDPLDVQDTYHAIRRAIDERVRLPAMGQVSREIVRDHSPSHAADAILDACSIALGCK